MSPTPGSPILEVSEPLVDFADLQDMELVVLKRMKEYAVGAHPSVFQGEGFDFVGLRDWQPGDRPSDIDWAQSTLTNFSPMVSREFEQESTASMMIVADSSLSTRCGVDGVPIAKVIARSIATLGLAAAFFQDQVGLVTHDGVAQHLAVRPRVGKNHIVHCLESYQAAVFGLPTEKGNIQGTLAGMLRRRSFVPVVSDFLFEGAPALFAELGHLAAVHDVFVVMVDGAFAYRLPRPSSGWVEAYDVETGQTRLLSVRELEGLHEEVRAWQDEATRSAERVGLEVVRVAPDDEHGALAGFLGERRLRRR